MHQSFNRWFLRLSCLASLVILQACATSPYSSENKARSDALLDTQLTALTKTTEDAPARLFVLSAALHDQSRAFRGDVDAFAKKMSEIHPRAMHIRLANPTIGQAADLPYATRENITRAVSHLAGVMRPVDRAVVMLTSHGNKDQLAVHAGAQAYPMISGAILKDMLKPLESFDHGVVISACHSGSLLPSLQHANRWVLTAAAADRVSFGCQFNGTQTYYMQALLNQTISATTTLRQFHEGAVKGVIEKETRDKLSPHSNPQWRAPSKYAPPITMAQLLGL